MIEISNLDNFGRGIGRINNKIIFVKNALPNEIIELKIIKDKKNYSEGIVERYIKLSNKRINPKCPYFEQCGGCDLMHISYDDQLVFKQQKIENIMKNLNIKPKKIVKCDNIYCYRNKITFHVNEKLGLFAKESNNIIEIDKCLIANENINNIIPELKKLNLSNIKKIICKNINNQLMIIIESSKEPTINSSLKELCSIIIHKYNNKYKIIHKRNTLIATINNKKYQISPDSFFQVNLNITEKLYNKIKEYCALLKSDQVLDLYCGTGTIGIYISDIVKKIIGIEINKDAINDAIINKNLNNINNIEFIANDVEKVINTIPMKPDTIIVDPPRSGLSKKTIETIIKIKSNNIIYVSCDPMTLARDLNILKSNYTITELIPFDMFPHTHHVECLTVLNLKK